MKKIITVLLILCTFTSFAQNGKKIKQVEGTNEYVSVKKSKSVVKTDGVYKDDDGLVHIIYKHGPTKKFPAGYYYYMRTPKDGGKPYQQKVEITN